MDRSHDPSETVIALFGRLPKGTEGLQQQIYAQQQAMVIKNQLAMGLINIVNGLLVAVGAAAHAPLRSILLWYLPIMLMGIIQVFSWLSFRKRPKPEKVSGSYLRKAELASLAIGTTWGAASLMLASNESDAHLLFVWMMQAGMAAGLTSILGPAPRITSRFVFACLFPVTVMNFVRGGDYALTIAVLGTIFMAVLVQGSINSYRQLKSLVATVHESNSARERLADAIESSNDAFAFYDAENDLLIANARHRDWFASEKPEYSKEGEDSVPVLLDSGRWLMRSSRKTGKGGAVVVHTDITALKTRERELIEAQREAVEADEAKSRFLSTMSHELRTPMNIILGFSKLMKGESKITLSPDDVREYADNIHASGTHLLKLINDIIDYSKVGLERMPVHSVELDTRALLSEAITLAAGFEGKASTEEFDVSVSAKLSMLYADETAMKRILINLVTNAIRFNEPGQKIVIRAGVDPDGAPFIAVRDFGQGIPESKLEKVFDAFYQADSHLDREHGGTGLGLTLCRHLARLMSGDVVLKSRIGVGTTAILTLPPSAIGTNSGRAAPSEDDEWIGPVDRDVA